MNSIKKRILLFLVGCMGTRFLLVYLAKQASLNILMYMGYIALLPAIGFLYIFVFGIRQTGPEVFGDKIWWNNLRPIHSMLYFLFAYNAINGHKYAWIYLLADGLIGLISFLWFHWIKNLAKLKI